MCGHLVKNQVLFSEVIRTAIVLFKVAALGHAQRCPRTSLQCPKGPQFQCLNAHAFPSCRSFSQAELACRTMSRAGPVARLGTQPFCEHLALKLP